MTTTAPLALALARTVPEFVYRITSRLTVFFQVTYKLTGKSWCVHKEALYTKTTSKKPKKAIKALDTALQRQQQQWRRQVCYHASAVHATGITVTVIV